MPIETTYHYSAFNDWVVGCQNLLTSGAAGRTTGFAVDFFTWLKKEGWYEEGFNAGLMQANFMLMTDRQAENEVKLKSGQDSVWGGGRFRARIFNDFGMNSPYGWRHGYVANVQDGQKIYEPILATIMPGASGELEPVPERLPVGVDRIKAVMWWPEPWLGPLNEWGADIKLSLVRNCDSPLPGGAGLVQADLSVDNRKMVFIEGDQVRPCYYWLKIEAFEMSANPFYNSWDAGRDVFWAYFFEGPNASD